MVGGECLFDNDAQQESGTGNPRLVNLPTFSRRDNLLWSAEHCYRLCFADAASPHLKPRVATYVKRFGGHG
jgi:hypothetical protein